ncbi:MAG: hypothetical protein V3W00_04510 [Candidatus Brocadiales bacterium]
MSFLFAIWCKEMVYTAPVIMFLYYLCFIEDGWRASLRAFKLLTPYLLLAVVSFYVSMPLGDESITPNWGRWEYLLTQSGVLIDYAKLLLLPIPGRLNVDYDVRLTETLWGGRRINCGDNHHRGVDHGRLVPAQSKVAGILRPLVLGYISPYKQYNPTSRDYGNVSFISCGSGVLPPSGGGYPRLV